MHVSAEPTWHNIPVKPTKTPSTLIWTNLQAKRCLGPRWMVEHAHMMVERRLWQRSNGHLTSACQKSFVLSTLYQLAGVSNVSNVETVFEKLRFQWLNSVAVQLQNIDIAQVKNEREYVKEEVHKPCTSFCYVCTMTCLHRTRPLVSCLKQARVSCK